MKNITPLLTLLYLWTNAAALTDDFERPNTQPGAPAEETIGEGYAMNDSAASAYLEHGQVRFAWTPGTSRNAETRGFVLHRKDYSLGDTFRISGEVTALGVEAASILYGLAFNFQPDGRFYALRINTGKPESAMQLVEHGADGRPKQIEKWGAPTAPEVNATYLLTVESVEPGVLKVSAAGPGLGDDFGGEVRLKEPSLRGGTAGFYTSRPTKSLALDNLTLSSGSDETD